MPFKIQNWKLSLLALLFICIFTSLGFWQLSRANQKKLLLASFTERTMRTPLTVQDINHPGDWRFYQARLEGSFDNAHTMLLDNKIYQGMIGYEVYTPFKASGMDTPIMVDRGFIPIGKSRKDLPVIKNITGNITITGMLNLPPTYVALGQIYEAPSIRWPLRIEYVNLSEFPKFLGYSVYPYVLNIEASDSSAYEVRWQPVTMSPEKHTAYAVQWFALALTLLILFVALNRKPKV